MPTVTISPNMALPVPIVSQTPGPEWAQDYNSCLSIVDQHNHSSGSGVQITQDGISLTGSVSTFDSLNFNTSNAYALRSVRFTAQSAALGLATDLGCIYEAGVDLYYNDGSGNQIRLTQGGSIVGTAGSITGLPSGTASASYSGGTFVWQSATNTAANMDAGSYIYRNNTASSKGLTLSPPNAMAADYGLFLPALPGSQSIMSLDASGNMAATYTVDNSTIVITSNIIKVATGGITATQIASGTITATQIANATITGAKIAAATVTKANQIAVGQQVSSSCGGYTAFGGFTGAITNLTITLTTVGRPVMLFLMPASTGALVGYLTTSSGTSGFSFFRNGSLISNFSVTVASSNILAGNFTFLDVFAAAGSNIYTFVIVTNPGTITANNIVLAGYEL